MRKGFTLIELLIVIAIIAILAAILFPVFAKAREKARQTSCLNNQRQIVTATMLYVQDHDETLPTASNFWGSINLDKGVLKCPTASRIANGYCFNGGEDGGGFHLSGMALGKITSPADAMLVADGTQNNIPTGYSTGIAGIQMLGNGHSEGDVLALTRHNGGLMIGYVDGHVALTTKSADIDSAFYAGAPNLPAYTATGNVVFIAWDDPNGVYTGWGGAKVTTVPGSMPITGTSCFSINAGTAGMEESYGYDWTSDSVVLKGWYFIPSGTTVNQMGITFTPDAGHDYGAVLGSGSWSGAVVYDGSPHLVSVPYTFVTGQWTQITLTRTQCNYNGVGGNPTHVYRFWPVFSGSGKIYMDGFRFESQ